MTDTKAAAKKKPSLRRAIFSFVLAVVSLVLAISELHGWHIAAASVVGGVCFIFGVVMLRRKYSKP